MSTALPRPGHCVVMGVVNVTPDSFSDGGRYADTDSAVRHGRRLWSDGADVLKPRGVLVVIEAEHLCMAMRGVRKPGATTVTSAVRGIFRDNAPTRSEAMSLILGR